MIEKVVDGDSMEQVAAVFGNFDENVKIIEKELQVGIISRDTSFKITGDEANVEIASQVLENLLNISRTSDIITEQNVRYVLSMVADGMGSKLAEIGGDCVCITAKGKPIKPKTLGQKKYIQTIKQETITLGIGPAGTGKTYLAVAAAVAAFRNRDVNRIILTRPAVEAGEKLGFLPGDLQNKVDPYLRPLYDALYDMLGSDSFMKYFEKGSIEVAPLAYMRGRTLDDSFIILDEAQNATPEQMKMFLTRIGFGSKAVITGDITQIDLPGGIKSGLKEASRVLKNIEGIGMEYLSEKDVVRHPLIQKIIKAYERYETDKERKQKKK